MRLPSVLQNRPLLFWAVVFLGLPAVLMIIPLDWSQTGARSILRQKPPLHVFSERIAEIDRALTEGRTVTMSAGRLQKVQAMLQARRLLEAGPMDEGEIRGAVKMCREMNHQIDREDRPASRRAVRSMWHERLGEAFPRLRTSKIAPALEKLRRQFDTQLEVRQAKSIDEGA